MKRPLYLLLVLPLLLLTACDTTPSLTETVPPEQPADANLAQSSSLNQAQSAHADLALRVTDDAADAQAYLARLNEQLAEDDVQMAVQKAEWMTAAPENHGAGQTVFANDRTLRLESQWVPGDERRDADGDKLTHVIWEPAAIANIGTASAIDAASIIDASLDTWDGVKCSKLDIETLGTTSANPSNFFVGGNPFLADIATVGFLPGALFDLVLEPGASESVLGVTFTFVFIDETGEPTDINDDGYADIALKEVWYNDDFQWATDPSAGVDIETVALHENGHALGLGHFGKIFVTGNNQKLHVAPRAVMNASYLGGATREPLGTDNGAYCGLYSSWGK